GRSPAQRSSGLRGVMARLERRVRRASRIRPARVATPLGTASSRRVVIKVRVVQLGTAEQKLRALRHFDYLERDGVDKDGSPGDDYAGTGRLERGAIVEAENAKEKHQFRLVISREEGSDLHHETYVQRYMARLKQDLGRKLVWVAVNHYHTDNPHAHVVIR